MKGITRLVAAALGLGTLIFLAACTEGSGWNTGFNGIPVNSAGATGGSY